MSKGGKGLAARLKKYNQTYKGFHKVSKKKQTALRTEIQQKERYFFMW